MKMRQEDLLIHKLVEYGNTDMYPFHMPGHKRTGDMGFPDPFTVDITEIDGFDNLHHPEGILKESMEWAARLYGADQTYYLVNGSSSGIISAVCGAVPRGGRILVSRNCHKSVYHGVYLNQLKASYVYPQEIQGLGIQGGITAEDVDKMLKRYMDTQAVLIVSPTYDGVVSDIRGIAAVVHGAGLPLIVDEAHGAHFRYGEMFPASSLDLGADVVIQSVHKTMPSLTQTALLHIKNNRPDGGCYADRSRIDRYVHMIQTSSPSYVLMASIENSIFRMEHMDPGLYGERLLTLRKRLGEMKHLRLVDTEIVGNYGVFDLDRSKIVICAQRPDLNNILRMEYHLEMEMCGADYVTAITTVMDSREGMERLGDALLEIDGKPDLFPQEFYRPVDACSIYSIKCDTAMTIAAAMDCSMDIVKLKESAGCISGEFIYLYPPGIPIVVPGEWISRQVLSIILEYIHKKLPVQGPEDQSLAYIRVVKKVYERGSA